MLHLDFSLLPVTVSYYRSSKVILACVIFLATWLHLTLFSLSVRFRSISNSEIHQSFLALLQFCVFLYWVLIGSLCIPSFWIYIYLYTCMYIICFCVFSTLSWNSLKIQRLENIIRLELMSVFTLTSSLCTQWEKKEQNTLIN